jgi:hypothetical protein
MENLPLDIFRIIATNSKLKDILRLSLCNKYLYKTCRNKEILKILQTYYTIIKTPILTHNLEIETRIYYRCDQCNEIEWHKDLLYKVCDYCNKKYCRKNNNIIYNERPESVVDCYWEICNECVNKNI